MGSNRDWIERVSVVATPLFWVCALLLHTAAVTAGGIDPTSVTPPQAVNQPSDQARLRVIKFNNYKSSETHRVVVELETKMLRDFATSAGLEIEWIDAFRSEEVFQKLIDGDGDLSVSAVPIDRRNDPRLHASVPIALQQFRVVGRHDETAENPLGLNGKTLAVKLSSPLWPYLSHLRQVLTDLTLHVLPDDLSTQAMLELVSNGTYDAALLASDFRSEPVTRQSGLKYLFDLTGPESVSWYVREDKRRLIDQLNEFIKRYHTAYNIPDPSIRRFSDIKRHGALRVITRFDGNNYFLNRGRPAGFDLDLAWRFAERHGLRLDVLVERDDEQILRWLRSGAGDLVTTRINERLVDDQAEFAVSRDYRHDAVVLVSSAKRPIRSQADLGGKFVAGYEGSSKIAAVTDFMAGAGSVIAVDRRVSLPLLLERIESGVLDAAVIAGHQLKAALAINDGIIAGMSVPDLYRYRWTLRGNDPQLADAVDKFFRNEYRKETDNILVRPYVTGPKKSQPAFAEISPFDALLQTYAERYGFDWRLIAAQMYQESQFDPHAVSRAGAIGLLQIMPATANSLGFRNPDDPEAGIHAGVKYLNRLRNRFDDHIPMDERTWFALAAYNIGYDHVRRARNRAREAGLNPHKWFGNVEVAMREMTRSYWESSTGDGCRCGQATIYVRSIRSLYYAYRNFVLAVESPQPDAISRPVALAPARNAAAG